MDNKYCLFLGDCLEKLKKEISNDSVDAIVTDPPYGVGNVPRVEHLLASWLGFSDEAKAPKATKATDLVGSSYVPGPELWRECYRVLKPGAYMAVFFSARTYDVGTMAVRLAGFEVVDQIMWLYGQGMACGKNRLKPAHEPIGLFRKAQPKGIKIDKNKMQMDNDGDDGKLKGVIPLLNIDCCRIPYAKGEVNTCAKRYRMKTEFKEEVAGKKWNHVNRGSQFDEEAKAKSDLGRWPANVIYTESESGELEEKLQNGSKFFYCMKPKKIEKGEFNDHPTVKPVELMKYLIQLILPQQKNGVLLDPFMGSGTTGVALKEIDFQTKFIGIEKDAHYHSIAMKRMII